MDYPKSVANVGLVNGKFVDEDTVTGVVGSLIPSVWGNSVTDEVIGAIRSAGLEPVEGKNDQLAQAIGLVVTGAQPGQASETVRGTAKVASQAQINAGADDTVIVTPKKLLGGFSMLGATNGYLAFPQWLGGLILQWGTTAVEASTTKTITLPTAFRTAAYGVVATFGIPSESTVNAEILSITQIRLQSIYSGGAQRTNWFAWGK